MPYRDWRFTIREIAVLDHIAPPSLLLVVRSWDPDLPGSAVLAEADALVRRYGAGLDLAEMTISPERG